MPLGKTTALSVLYAFLQATCCTAFPPKGIVLEYTEFVGPICGDVPSAHKQVENYECFLLECSDFDTPPPACVKEPDTKFYQSATCSEAFESDCSQVGLGDDYDSDSSSSSSICNLQAQVEFFTEAGCDKEALLYTWKGLPANEDIASVDLDYASCDHIKDHHATFNRFDNGNAFKEFSIKATCVLPKLSPPPRESFFDYLTPSSGKETYRGLYAIGVICGLGSLVVAYMLYTKHGLIPFARPYSAVSV